MSEETAVLESSAPVEAPVMEVSRGPLVNLTPEQRAEYKTTGVLPTPKTEEAAPSSDAEPTGEAKPAGDSETPPVQEKPKAEPKKQTAAERIAELKATIAKIEKGAGIKTEAESSPVKPEPKLQPTQPQNYQEWNKEFDPDQWIEQYSKDNPTASFERTNAAMHDYKNDMREHFKVLAQQQEANSKALNAKVEEGRARYENLDSVIVPAANEIYNDPGISPVVKQMIADSDLIVDLVYTIANDPAEYAKFVKMAKDTPGKAIRYIALTESLISQELEGKQVEAPKTEVEPPAKPRTQAPKPPAEAGGRGTTPPDTLQAALEGSGGKLNAGLKAEFLRRDLARLKG